MHEDFIMPSRGIAIFIHPKRKISILINIIIRVGQIDQWDSVVKNENEAGVGTFIVASLPFQPLSLPV